MSAVLQLRRRPRRFHRRLRHCLGSASGSPGHIRLHGNFHGSGNSSDRSLSFPLHLISLTSSSSAFQSVTSPSLNVDHFRIRTRTHPRPTNNNDPRLKKRRTLPNQEESRKRSCIGFTK